MQTAVIPYQDQETNLEGFVVCPSQGKCPTVILCHTWKGRDPSICKAAEQMAERGYVGFALDMYGRGILGKSREENAALKKPFIQDRHSLQRRILKAWEVVHTLPYVDTIRIGALGFGFGGVCALDLARSGVTLRGVVSVYGHFGPPQGLPKKIIRSKILILHGYGDPISTLEDLHLFEQEMNEAHVDWQVHTYSNTVHAFTEPSANDPVFGTVYNPLSTQRAWRSIQDFFEEIFL